MKDAQAKMLDMMSKKEKPKKKPKTVPIKEQYQTIKESLTSKVKDTFDEDSLIAELFKNDVAEETIEPNETVLEKPVIKTSHGNGL